MEKTAQNRHGCVAGTSRFPSYAHIGGSGPKAPGERVTEWIGAADPVARLAACRVPCNPRGRVRYAGSSRHRSGGRRARDRRIRRRVRLEGRRALRLPVPVHVGHGDRHVHAGRSDRYDQPAPLADQGREPVLVREARPRRRHVHGRAAHGRDVHVRRPREPRLQRHVQGGRDQVGETRLRLAAAWSTPATRSSRAPRFRSASASSCSPRPTRPGRRPHNRHSGDRRRGHAGRRRRRPGAGGLAAQWQTVPRTSGMEFAVWAAGRLHLGGRVPRELRHRRRRQDPEVQASRLLPNGSVTRSRTHDYGGHLVVAFATLDKKSQTVVGLARGDARGGNVRVVRSITAPGSLGPQANTSAFYAGIVGPGSGCGGEPRSARTDSPQRCCTRAGRVPYSWRS